MPPVRRIVYKAYGLNIDVSLNDNLPSPEGFRARLLETMKTQVTPTVRKQIIASLAASGVSPSPTLVGGLKETHWQAAGVTGGRVAFDKDQAYKARFLNYGTAEHDILAQGATTAARAQRRRQGRRDRYVGRPIPHALVFRTPSGPVFARSAHHPGIRARRFLEAAGIAATPSIVAAFQRALTEAGSSGPPVTATSESVYGRTL